MSTTLLALTHIAAAALLLAATCLRARKVLKVRRKQPPAQL
ncbi:hypothetical protein [Variovorax sp. SRS16]|nr:hypothetical protein [Variovorax sp. SRS16]